MEHFFDSLHGLQFCALLLALVLALGFEFVNGFHDTANAVATIIYTNSLPPTAAVVWSGLCNLAGVLASTGTVAYGVLSLLPAELVMNVQSAAGFSMVFSLLISAMVWNLGTWYRGLPASSSHTLIGSMMGVGLMHSIMTSGGIAGGANWGAAKNIGLSLLVSPAIGFACAGLLFLLIKLMARQPELYQAPEPNKPPPLWIRGILCATCTGVSFAHGSNDGQKGMGLIMLVLIGIIPGAYALNPDAAADSFAHLHTLAQRAEAIVEMQTHGAPMPAKEATPALEAFLKVGKADSRTFAALAGMNRDLLTTFADNKTVADLTRDGRSALRSKIYLVSETIGKLRLSGKLPEPQSGGLVAYKAALDGMVRFIPVWVKIAVAVALGFGTMIGWKRIVVTVGEKIGKSHLTYAQGASAEIIAMVTISLADRLGLPVSTTHVLSSGVAGTMAANRSGLQKTTLRNVLLAWVLSLPVCIFLGAMFFAAGLLLATRIFGLG